MRRYQRSLVHLVRRYCPSPIAGCEIGVYKGWMAACYGSWFKGCKMYFVDPWKEWPEDSTYYSKTSRDQGKFVQSEWDSICQEALVRIADSGIRRFEILRMLSSEASELVCDGELDFVSIDAAHDSESVAEDIRLWLPKARRLICGHDYGGRYHGVKRAVDAAFGERVIVRPGKVWAVRL